MTRTKLGEWSAKTRNAMTAAEALDALFDRHGRIPPASDPRLHPLRQAAMWLLQYHGALQDRRTELLAHADASQLMQTIRRIARQRRPRNAFGALPDHRPHRARARIRLRTEETSPV